MRYVDLALPVQQTNKSHLVVCLRAAGISDIYIQTDRKRNMMEALKRSVGRSITLVISSGMLPAVWDIQPPPGSKVRIRGEVQIPAAMEEEFGRRLQEKQI